MRVSDETLIATSPLDQPVDRHPKIIADVAGSFTYASYQNAIPVIRSIEIDNADGRNCEKCRVELTSSPAFLRLLMSPLSIEQCRGDRGNSRRRSRRPDRGGGGGTAARCRDGRTCIFGRAASRHDPDRRYGCTVGPVTDDLYRLTDLTGFVAEPDRFQEFAYRDTLRAMVAAVIEAESPLRTDILCQRIARAHGWLRTGGKIRERIDMHLRDFDRTQESSGEFIWKAGDVTDSLARRSA